ncbi:FecR family protein [Zunongwangia sp.]|uniref:FecR family protein n=1 Tax=Zunongwangia sp. TaxID=1965325 RepID=UPI003AA9BF17
MNKDTNFDKDFNDFWNEEAPKCSTKKKEAEWETFASKKLRNKNTSFQFKYWRYAAAIFVLVIASVSFIYFTKSVAFPDAEVTIVSNLGEKIKRVKLPDSSSVQLYPNSKLTYTTNFRANRKVELSGEAFFDVSKDKKHPFSVTCLKTITTVLGTSFSIKQNPQKSVHIKLYEGSIKMNVKGDYKSWLLAPGEEITYSKNNVLVSNFERFKDFNNTTLKDLISYINQQYSYKIEIPEKYINQKITLRIRKKEMPKTICKTIAEIYDLEFIIDQSSRKIIFYSKQ